MRSVSLVFARNLLLIGDGAAGFPSAFALDGPGLPRARWSQQRSRFVQKGMLSRSPTGARPMFREQGGRGAAGRKRGRRSDRLQMLHRKQPSGRLPRLKAASRRRLTNKIGMPPLPGIDLMCPAFSRSAAFGTGAASRSDFSGGVEGIAELFVRQVKPVEHVDSRAGRAVECKSRRKTACAVTDQQQTARENDQTDLMSRHVPLLR